MSDPTGTTTHSTGDPEANRSGTSGQAPMPMPPSRRREPSAFSEAVAPTTQALRIPPGAQKPTDIAKTNALNADRAKRGLPPLPRRRGVKRPGKGRHFVRWLALTLVAMGLAFGGTSAWAYFTGVIGPLRGADAQGAQAFALANDAPDWATADQLSCAGQRLVRDQGVIPLAKAGVLTGKSGHYSYSGRWPSNLAVTWYETLIACVNHDAPGTWADKVADSWSLENGACIKDIGSQQIAGVLAATGVALTDRKLDGTNAGAITSLDRCYAATKPAAPTGTATSGYRQVGLVVRRPEVTNGVAALAIADAEPTDEGKTEQTFTLPVSRGGAQACVEARTQVTYAWGTVRVGDPTRVCGTASPAKMAWRKVDHSCRTGVKRCSYASLYVEGMASSQQLHATYKMSGDFLCPHKKKTCSVAFKADATGHAHTPAVEVTGRHDGHIDARLGSLRALFPTD